MRVPFSQGVFSQGLPMSDNAGASPQLGNIDHRMGQRFSLMSGDDENNRLEATGRANIMRGNEGADTFDFGSARGVSVITDFNPLEGDMLSLLDFSNVNVSTSTELDRTIITFGGGGLGGVIMLLGFSEAWNNDWFESDVLI